MADVAAFFANKKRKKVFKFNANLIDAAMITNKTHVEAPALSNDQDGLVKAEAPVEEQAPRATPETSSEWDDEALAAASTARKAATQTEGVLDMKKLDNPAEDSDIKERILKEETKAQLAAAREGMEREAARLNKEKKKETTTQSTSSRFGAAAANMGGGSRWVPPHMRGGGGPTATMPGKLDTQSQELFPSLASADAILEKKEKAQQPVYKAPKKTPVGGGASWASKVPSKETQAPAPKPAPAPAPKPVAAAAPPVKKTLTKKKKKDLSAFKKSG